MPLSPAEQRVARDAGVDADLYLVVKKLARATIRRADAVSAVLQTQPADGIAVNVRDGERADQLMTALAPILAPRGYRAFWSHRRASSGKHVGDEVVVLKTDDPYAIVRLRQSNGLNYGISNDEVLVRLRRWESLCAFDCVGASQDWVALTFKSLPKDLCSFAAEVYSFCPDSAERVGLADESADPSLFEAARRLCPEVPSILSDRLHRQLPEIDTLGDDVPPPLRALVPVMRDSMVVDSNESPDMSIRLLAETIRRERYLFLWWD